MPSPRPKPSKKVSKPVPLGGVKKKKVTEDSLWKEEKPSARSVSVMYRKKSQAGRLTAEQMRKVTEREKDRLMDERAKQARKRARRGM